MEKITRRVKNSQRRSMRALQVRNRSDAGYGTYLVTAGGARFNGAACHSADGKLIAEAVSMAEPAWDRLSLSELEAAEKMARHRVSGGETRWQRVLERIRETMVIARRQKR